MTITLIRQAARTLYPARSEFLVRSNFASLVGLAHGQIRIRIREFLTRWLSRGNVPRYVGSQRYTYRIRLLCTLNYTLPSNPLICFSSLRHNSTLAASFIRFLAFSLNSDTAMAGETVDFKLYRYDPSMAAAIVFIVLFLIVTALHFYQMMRTRTWIFVPFVLGGVCMYSLTPIFDAKSQLTNYRSRSHWIHWRVYYEELGKSRSRKLTYVQYRELSPPKRPPIGQLPFTRSKPSFFWSRPRCSQRAST